jgi:hypothetical protein
LTTLGNNNSTERLVVPVGRSVLDPGDCKDRSISTQKPKNNKRIMLTNVHTVDDLTKDDSDEELRAVGAWAGVGHREQTRLGVLLVKVLVCELGAVDRLAATTVAEGKVT